MWYVSAAFTEKEIQNIACGGSAARASAMPVSTLGRSVLTVGCSAVYMYHVYSNMPEERQAAIQEVERNIENG